MVKKNDLKQAVATIVMLVLAALLITDSKEAARPIEMHKHYHKHIIQQVIISE